VAGACSVSVITIKKMARPTDKAPKTIYEVLWLTNRHVVHSDRDRKWQKQPTDIPTRYPPIMNLGLETSYLGMVKAMKELAPRAATVAVCVKTSRKTSTMAMIEVARAHCNIYLGTLCLNFLSIILIITPVSLPIVFVHGFYHCNETLTITLFCSQQRRLPRRLKPGMGARPVVAGGEVSL
jgi:hypothetical protein